jgi:hypothetical protein
MRSKSKKNMDVPQHKNNSTPKGRGALFPGKNRVLWGVCCFLYHNILKYPSKMSDNIMLYGPD